jgi:hypothetical protein
VLRRNRRLKIHLARWIGDQSPKEVGCLVHGACQVHRVKGSPVQVHTGSCEVAERGDATCSCCSFRKSQEVVDLHSAHGRSRGARGGGAEHFVRTTNLHERHQRPLAVIIRDGLACRAAYARSRPCVIQPHAARPLAARRLASASHCRLANKKLHRARGSLACKNACARHDI